MQPVPSETQVIQHLSVQQLFDCSFILSTGSSTSIFRQPAGFGADLPITPMEADGVLIRQLKGVAAVRSTPALSLFAVIETSDKGCRML